jgi:hypothetical protein
MQGFYKNDNGFLVWSADRVLNERFELWIDKKDTYEYPVEGWYWFDSEAEARNTLKCYTPSPYPSWQLDSDANWQPPTPYPNDGDIYQWVEDDLNWQLVESGA